VNLKLKPATVGLTDNDRFHLLVRLTGGGAPEQLGLLQETLQQEVKARNEPLQREYERSLLTYQGKLVAYEVLTDEQKVATDRREAPEEPVLSNSSFNQLLDFGVYWKTFTQKVNSSDLRVSGFSDEACEKYGKHGF
jgi:hypothetical protein